MEEGGGVTLYFCSVLINQTFQNYCSNLHLSRFVRDLNNVQLESTVKHTSGTSVFWPSLQVL